MKHWKITLYISNIYIYTLKVINQIIDQDQIHALGVATMLFRMLFPQLRTRGRTDGPCEVREGSQEPGGSIVDVRRLPAASFYVGNRPMSSVESVDHHFDPG